MTAKMSAAGLQFLELIKSGLDRKSAMKGADVSERTSYRLAAKAKKKGKKRLNYA